MMQDLQNRFSIFLEKLKNRAEEIASEAKNISQSVYDEDEDVAKRWYFHFQNGIRGQFDSIKQKAEKIYKNEIEIYGFDKKEERFFLKNYMIFWMKLRKFLKKFFLKSKKKIRLMRIMKFWKNSKIWKIHFFVSSVEPKFC